MLARVRKTLPVHPHLRHPRTGEPIQAIGVINGRPIWPVMGGAPDGDEDGDDGDGDGDGDGKDGDADGDDKDGDGDGDDKDGDGDEDGKKDWRAEAEKWKRLSRQNERAARKAQGELDRAKGKKQPKAGDKKPPKADDGDGSGDDQPDVEQIREDARREALETAAKDRALDKVEARAASKFEDPEVAAALLRGRVDEFVNGTEIDVEAIDDAIDDLLEKKPHLAKGGRKGDDDGDSKDGKDGKSGKRPKGSGDGGPKDGKPARPRSLHDAVAGRLNPNQ